MEGDCDYTDFAGNAFRAPGEIAGVETKSAVLLVTTSSAYKMDTLGSDSSVGWLPTFLEGSAIMLGRL